MVTSVLKTIIRCFVPFTASSFIVYSKTRNNRPSMFKGIAYTLQDQFLIYLNLKYNRIKEMHHRYRWS